MVKRIAAMVSIMSNTIKTGKKSCDIPVNKFCIAILRLLRSHQLIHGFQYTSPGTKTRRLYPRVKVLFKYNDVNTPALIFLKPIKNTASQFELNKKYGYMKQHHSTKMFLVTTPRGLNLLTFKDIHSALYKVGGKRVLELAW